MTSNIRVLMRVISLIFICPWDWGGTSEIGPPPSNALLLGQVSTLGQGFILQRLGHELSNKTTSPRRLQGKNSSTVMCALLYAGT
jgi:hypothetical protein